jgi:hypothetical protein
VSVLGARHQRVAVENEAPIAFGEHAVEPVWCVSVQETAAYRHAPMWEVVAVLSLNCKTKQDALREASEVLRGWLATLAAEGGE